MKLGIFFILILLFFSSNTSAQEHNDQGFLVGHSLRMMKTAGFWISRHPSPDNIIMDAHGVENFNADLRRSNLVRDIFAIHLTNQTLLKNFEKTLEDFTQKGYYTADGVINDEKFIDGAKNNINLAVSDTQPRYGLVVHYAYQRFLPTNQGLYEEKNDYDFDQVQNSALDVGTPVVVIHVSTDGLWYFVVNEISDGWVEAKNVALGSIDQVKGFAEAKNFAVVIKPKADIFLNESMTDFDDYLRMGMRLPFIGSDAGRATVEVPVMGPDGLLLIRQAYMNAEDVNPGVLPFTARNIYKQALMMLNEPYGWGDMYGEQDCSRFLQMVFATMGISLPRDSKIQGLISDKAIVFDAHNSDAAKIAAINKSSAAITFLVLKGHIMLYLGSIDRKPYAIHDTSGYKQKIGFAEINHDLNRVVISDLSLGQGSSKGSLLERLTKIVTIE